MTTIALIDYGAGNLTSVVKGLAAAGADVRIVSAPGELDRVAGIVVPGVGHFRQTAVFDAGWRDAIRRRVETGIPLLGICLGMQWLFEGSDEAPDVAGLGLFSGRAVRLSGDVKVPHVGWNALRQTSRMSRLLDWTSASPYAYFAHAFAVPPGEQSVALTDHGVSFTSVVERGRVIGTQFHPEKSGPVGLQLLERFVTLARVGVARAGSGGGRPADDVERPAGERGGVNQPVQPGAPTRLSRRIIACLDVRDGRVVKGVQFQSLREAGDPAALARRYDDEGIDELVVLDVTATLEGRRALADTIRAVSRELFVPLAVGGGIRSFDDARAVVEAGADKVCVNSAALADPALITRLAERYGSQAVVVAIDAERSGQPDPATRRARFRVRSRSGTTAEARDAVAWAREAETYGAGEILLTSIDRDGTRAGFDCEMTAAVSHAVQIPVIASGGAGEPGHFADVFTSGRADAALAASVFHFSEHAVADLKASLSAEGIPVRPIERGRGTSC